MSYRPTDHVASSLMTMTTYVAVFAMVMGYVALVAAYCALRTLAKLRRATSVLARGSRGAAGRESLLQATERHAGQTAALAAEMAQLRSYVDTTCTQAVASAAAISAEHPDCAGALRKIALVRYDAFEDVAGRMSFSLALLDEHGDGVTISAIAGRSDTRVYAKGVSDGKGEHELSPEEQQAVAAALNKRRSGLLHRAG